MQKYHINPGTGRVNICRATVRDCPVSGPENHYDSKEAAFAGREKKLEDELGTFSNVSKKTEEKLTRTFTPEMEKAASAYYEYNLDEVRRDSEDDARRIAKVAETYKLDPEFFKAEVMRYRKHDAERRAQAEDNYKVKIAEVIAATPEIIRKGSIIAVRYDSKTTRLMKVANVRRGKAYGPTIHDGELYEPVYMEDVDIQRDVLKPEPQAASPSLKVDEGWTRIPGEGNFKTIRDSSGEARGSIQLREGFYILGARDAATGRLISFEENEFAFEEEAADYLNSWAAKNPQVKLSD